MLHVRASVCARSCARAYVVRAGACARTCACTCMMRDVPPRFYVNRWCDSPSLPARGAHASVGSCGSALGGRARRCVCEAPDSTTSNCRRGAPQDSIVGSVWYLGASCNRNRYAPVIWDTLEFVGHPMAVCGMLVPNLSELACFPMGFMWREGRRPLSATSQVVRLAIGQPLGCRARQADIPTRRGASRSMHRRISCFSHRTARQV